MKKNLPTDIVQILKDVIENTRDNIDSMKRLGTDYFVYDRYEFLKDFNPNTHEDYQYDRDIQTITIQLIQMYLLKEIYIDSALKNQEKLDKKNAHKKVQKKPTNIKKISYKDFKILQN